MIKNGEFCIYNDNEYELNEDSDGNLIIITTNRAIIDETFVDKYNSGVYSKVILPNEIDRKSTRLNSSHPPESRMPSSA